MRINHPSQMNIAIFWQLFKIPLILPHLKQNTYRAVMIIALFFEKSKKTRQNNVFTPSLRLFIKKRPNKGIFCARRSTTAPMFSCRNPFYLSRVLNNLKYVHAILLFFRLFSRVFSAFWSFLPRFF